MFSNKKSSAKVLATLTKFNGIVCWITYSNFCQDINYIGASSARKQVGISILKNGKKAKEQCWDWFKETQKWYNIIYKKTRQTKGLLL